MRLYSRLEFSFLIGLAIPQATRLAKAMQRISYDGYGYVRIGTMTSPLAFLA
jgi:hypothetical protein